MAAIVLASCSTTENMTEAPKAKQIEKKITTHGDTRVDNYFWMRLSDAQKEAETPDAQTKDVLNYLNAENNYLKELRVSVPVNVGFEIHIIKTGIHLIWQLLNLKYKTTLEEDYAILAQKGSCWRTYSAVTHRVTQKEALATQ